MRHAELSDFALRKQQSPKTIAIALATVNTTRLPKTWTNSAEQAKVLNYRAVKFHILARPFGVTVGLCSQKWSMTICLTINLWFSDATYL